MVSLTKKPSSNIAIKKSIWVWTFPEYLATGHKVRSKSEKRIVGLRSKNRPRFSHCWRMVWKWVQNSNTRWNKFIHSWEFWKWSMTVQRHYWCWVQIFTYDLGIVTLTQTSTKTSTETTFEIITDTETRTETFTEISPETSVETVGECTVTIIEENNITIVESITNGANAGLPFYRLSLISVLIIKAIVLRKLDRS